jgi:phosphoribosyl-ATP pyrophosphohydrolase/phosphoribosyl-AMP cyclohydrolase
VGFFVPYTQIRTTTKEKMSNSTPTIDFEKMDGLAPGIVQDARTGEVLMLGFLNPVSYAKTLETGFVTFWSRTRQKLWMKGESSGNRLRVVSAATDCDNDTLLFRVVVEGDGLVCHEGTVSCFTKLLPTSAASQKSNREAIDTEENRG